MRRPMVAGLVAVVVILPLVAKGTSPQGTAKTPTPVSLAKMLGQQLVSSMYGTTPDATLLARVRAGHVGSVILYGANIVSPGQTKAAIRQLQGAALAGHNPPLLIFTDQEGGLVKRLPWAPPTVAPPQMGIDGTSVSRQQGIGTGIALRKVGINVDLAPEVDVAHSSSSFLWQEGRSFGMTSALVIHSAVPFALGLLKAHVIATAKHFPGLGGATTDTDQWNITLTIGPRDLAPYRSAIKNGIPLIMVANAHYPGLDQTGVPAPLSHRIITHLLRDKLGYKGAVITDDLVRLQGYVPERAALRAEDAGVDIIVALTDNHQAEVIYYSLLKAARKGQVPRATIEAAYQRIIALKQTYG